MHSDNKTVAIIGAGASGCFSAIEVKRRYPSYRVVVFDAGLKPMMKLALTGGGRCNLTNSFQAIDNLSVSYPRGEKLLKRLFYRFDNKSVMEWFENEGIELITQKDNCVFPLSQDAMQIVNKLENLMRQNKVELRCNKRAIKITKSEKYQIEFQNKDVFIADYIILTAGGTKQNILQQLLPEGIEITPTVPSLFTLKIPVPELRNLMGTVVNEVELGIVGTKYHSKGILLITDWGISGPATLCLSSYAATYLASTKYEAQLRINWLSKDEEETREQIDYLVNNGGNKLVTSLKPQCFTDRLWKYLLQRATLRENARYSEIGTKQINKLISVLTSDIYPIKGRAAFKEEFVTCGGVSLNSINPKTLESKQYPGLFFAGEVLDIDAITGGFNLQAAWTTAFVAADLGKL